MNTETAGMGAIISQKLKDYRSLFKVRLALSVVFSACTAYVLAVDTFSFSWAGFLVLAFGGFFVTASANALNQVLEKDTDKIMKRTRNRPLPTERMESSEAVLAAGILGVLGILMLALFNPLTAVLGALSLVTYAFIYTPMKPVSPAAVWIGAIPGALPIAIGWVAVTGEISIEVLFLFSLQFIWQFPHFWAIAWLSYEDYASAGFYLLPSAQKDGRNRSTVIQIMFYIGCLIAISFIPWVLGISGLLACTVMLLAGMGFMYFAIRLYRECTRKAARQLMLSSLLYQVIVFIFLMVDKL